MTSSTSYADAGVDIDAGNRLVDSLKNTVKSTNRVGADTNLGGFGGLFDLKATGFNDPVLVAATDGVGTKLEIAQTMGDHSTIGIDLVAMCVNDLVVQGAEPLFFLDYFATGKLEEKEALTVIEGIAEGCRQSGSALIGGETAEMPGMYAPGKYDLAGFSVGAVERNAILPRNDIQAGDALIALTSSGIHSNGYSLVRHVLKQNNVNYHDVIAEVSDQPIGSVLLTPTKIYVKACLELIQQGNVKALAHITGGGLTENLPRVLPKNINAAIDLSTWQLPALFNWLRKQGNIATEELLRTFNCGVGMVLVVPAEAASDVIASAEAHGQTAIHIGQLTDGNREVTYTGLANW
jgi:phosphoribosylformylglycinamidine cyclo-ligase